jgi:N-acyl-D-aspartate/D-glutamate deacylase
MLDLIIRGGTVIDGTGTPGRTADIGITGNRITEVGRVATPARRTLDADGLTVAPGWVDIHTHYDGQVCWDTELAPSSWQGVTTILMGNCGVGFAPVRPGGQNFLISLMEGVEDIPGTALHEGVKFTWESFPQYLDAIDRRFALDVGAQLPHGALRTYVMGERAAELADATEAERAEMGRLTEQAIRAGAFGFSTSRTVFHRTKAGGPTPSLTAAEAELLAIADGMRRAGTGVVEWVADFDDLEEDFGLLRRMAERSGRPASVGVAQRDDRPWEWRRTLELVDQAQAAGVDIKVQVAGRPVGILLGLESSFHPLMDYPNYAAIAGLPLAERVRQLRDPAARARILAVPPPARPPGLDMLLSRLDRMFPLGDPPTYEPAPETSVAARAGREGRPPIEVVIDMLLERGGTAMIYATARNYTDFNLDAVREMIQHPQALMGLGDGGAHVATLCDASMPTFAAAWWGRDRPRGRLPLEWIVMRQARDTARAIGLNDRGILAPGYRADLNLIDYPRLNALQPHLAYDLPAGGKRLLQKASGYVATLCGGEVTFEEGRFTGALPGRLVRGAQSI